MQSLATGNDLECPQHLHALRSQRNDVHSLYVHAFKGVHHSTAFDLRTYHMPNARGRHLALAQCSVERRLKLARRRHLGHSSRTNSLCMPNRKAERFVQTNLREWAYVRPYESSASAEPPCSLLLTATGFANTPLRIASRPSEEDSRVNNALGFDI